MISVFRKMLALAQAQTTPWQSVTILALPRFLLPIADTETIAIKQLGNAAGTATWKTTDPVIAVFPKLLTDRAAEKVLRELWKRESGRINEVTQSTLIDIFKHVVLCVWQATTSSLVQQTMTDQVGKHGLLDVTFVMMLFMLRAMGDVQKTLSRCHS